MAVKHAPRCLRFDDVHTYYGHIHALKGVSIEVQQGEVVTLIGSNGAGKSTTLKTISGLLHPRTARSALKGGGSAICPHIRSSRWASSNLPRVAGSSRE